MDQRLKNVWMVSFADSRLKKPRARIYRQALEFGFPKDHVRIMDENDLSGDFRLRMKDRLVLGSKGFGYWCWKPEVILETMEKIPDGDILLYIDIGCHLNKRGKERFYDYLKIAETKGAVGFQSRSLLSDPDIPDPRHHVRTNAEFCKGDILDYFKVRDNKDIAYAAQMIAGIVLFKKCAQNIDFVREWGSVLCDHPDLINDSPSKSPNMPEFVINRHDQAIFSIMWLLRGMPTVSSCEVENLRRHACPSKVFRHNPLWGKDWYWQMKYYPIHAKRDKGLVSFWRKLFLYMKHKVVLKFIRRMQSKREGKK